MKHGCLTCGELDFHYLNTAPLALCKNCGHLQRMEFPQESELKEYYQSKQYYIDHNNPIPSTLFASSYVRGHKILRFALLPDNHGIKTVTDLGCGHGGTVALFNDMQYQASGVDLNQEAISYARSRGLNCYCADITSELPKADMFILSHVVEHLPDPVGTLSRMRLMYPSSYFYIEVPRITGISSRGFDIRKFYAPVHISYFTLTTLINLMHVAGFELVKKHLIDTDMCCGLFKVANRNYRYKIKNDWLNVLAYTSMVELRRRLKIPALYFTR